MRAGSIINRTIIIATFLCMHQLLFAQQKTDGKFIFKTWLFLERANENFRSGNKFDTKDSSLFAFLDNVIDLKMDTLKSIGFSNNFVFLSVAQYKKDVLFHDSAITYKKFETTPTKEIHVGIPISYCDGYVLCINKSSGQSYRLHGFNGNDILSLIREVQEEDKKNNRKITSTKYFLTYYKVDGIDFNCIYKGITSGNNDSKKYPCLTSCRDFIITIH